MRSACAYKRDSQAKPRNPRHQIMVARSPFENSPDLPGKELILRQIKVKKQCSCSSSYYQQHIGRGNQRFSEKQRIRAFASQEFVSAYDIAHMGLDKW